jgi:membrane protein required for colicin V production
MNLADVLIVAVLIVSVVSAFVHGFFLEVFSLAGVVVGLSLAGANYSGFAPLAMGLVHNREAANLIAFLVIALLVMVLAGLVGRILRGLVRYVGLGIVDRIFGAVFGLVKGCIVVTLVLMGIVAFLPRQQWLDSSRLAPVFLTAAHGGSHVVPFELGEKIRGGLQSLRMPQPSWLKPSAELLCGATGSCPGSSGTGWYETNTNPAVERVGKGKRFL